MNFEQLLMKEEKMIRRFLFIYCILSLASFSSSNAMRLQKSPQSSIEDEIQTLKEQSDETITLFINQHLIPNDALKTRTEKLCRHIVSYGGSEELAHFILAFEVKFSLNFSTSSSLSEEECKGKLYGSIFMKEFGNYFRWKRVTPEQINHIPLALRPGMDFRLTTGMLEVIVKEIHGFHHDILIELFKLHSHPELTIEFKNEFREYLTFLCNEAIKRSKLLHLIRPFILTCKVIFNKVHFDAEEESKGT